MFSTCSLTASGSQMPLAAMSTISPLSPSMPAVGAPPACRARSAVSVRMVLAPQFCASVRGMISAKETRNV